MARCEECLHYELCSYNTYVEAKYFGRDKEIYITIKNNTACKFFKPTADVAPKSEVAMLLEDFQRSIRADAKVGMSAGEILLHINNMLVELKKKYIDK